LLIYFNLVNFTEWELELLIISMIQGKN
jgi:hypothetical protein